MWSCGQPATDETRSKILRPGFSTPSRGDLVDLARKDEKAIESELVEFDEFVGRAVARAQRRATSVQFDVSLDHGQVWTRGGKLTAPS